MVKGGREVLWGIFEGRVSRELASRSAGEGGIGGGVDGGAG